MERRLAPRRRKKDPSPNTSIPNTDTSQRQNSEQAVTTGGTDGGYQEAQWSLVADIEAPVKKGIKFNAYPASFQANTGKSQANHGTNLDSKRPHSVLSPRSQAAQSPFARDRARRMSLSRENLGNLPGSPTTQSISGKLPVEKGSKQALVDEADDHSSVTSSMSKTSSLSGIEKAGMKLSKSQGSFSDLWSGIKRETQPSSSAGAADPNKSAFQKLGKPNEKPPAGEKQSMPRQSKFLARILAKKQRRLGPTVTAIPEETSPTHQSAVSVSETGPMGDVQNERGMLLPNENRDEFAQRADAGMFDQAISFFSDAEMSVIRNEPVVEFMEDSSSNHNTKGKLGTSRRRLLSDSTASKRKTGDDGNAKSMVLMRDKARLVTKLLALWREHKRQLSREVWAFGRMSVVQEMIRKVASSSASPSKNHLSKENSMESIPDTAANHNGKLLSSILRVPSKGDEQSDPSHQPTLSELITSFKPGLKPEDFTRPGESVQEREMRQFRLMQRTAIAFMMAGRDHRKKKMKKAGVVFTNLAREVAKEDISQIKEPKSVNEILLPHQRAAKYAKAQNLDAGARGWAVFKSHFRNVLQPKAHQRLESWAKWVLVEQGVPEFVAAQIVSLLKSVSQNDPTVAEAGPDPTVTAELETESAKQDSLLGVNSKPSPAEGQGAQRSGTASNLQQGVPLHTPSAPLSNYGSVKKQPSLRQKRLRGSDRQASIKPEKLSSSPQNRHVAISKSRRQQSKANVNAAFSRKEEPVLIADALDGSEDDQEEWDEGSSFEWDLNADNETVVSSDNEQVETQSFSADQGSNVVERSKAGEMLQMQTSSPVNVPQMGSDGKTPLASENSPLPSINFDNDSRSLAVSSPQIEEWGDGNMDQNLPSPTKGEHKKFKKGRKISNLPSKANNGAEWVRELNSLVNVDEAQQEAAILMKKELALRESLGPILDLSKVLPDSDSESVQNSSSDEEKSRGAFARRLESVNNLFETREAIQREEEEKRSRALAKKMRLAMLATSRSASRASSANASRVVSRQGSASTSRQSSRPGSASSKKRTGKRKGNKSLNAVTHDFPSGTGMTSLDDDNVLSAAAARRMSLMRGASFGGAGARSMPLAPISERLMHGSPSGSRRGRHTPMTLEELKLQMHPDLLREAAAHATAMGSRRASLSMTNGSGKRRSIALSRVGLQGGAGRPISPVEEYNKSPLEVMGMGSRRPSLMPMAQSRVALFDSRGMYRGEGIDPIELARRLGQLLRDREAEEFGSYKQHKLYQYSDSESDEDSNGLELAGGGIGVGRGFKGTRLLKSMTSANLHTSVDDGNIGIRPTVRLPGIPKSWLRYRDMLNQKQSAKERQTAVETFWKQPLLGEAGNGSEFTVLSYRRRHDNALPSDLIDTHGKIVLVPETAKLLSEEEQAAAFRLQKEAEKDPSAIYIPGQAGGKGGLLLKNLSTLSHQNKPKRRNAVGRFAFRSRGVLRAASPTKSFAERDLIKSESAKAHTRHRTLSFKVTGQQVHVAFTTNSTRKLTARESREQSPPLITMRNNTSRNSTFRSPSPSWYNKAFTKHCDDSQRGKMLFPQLACRCREQPIISVVYDAPSRQAFASLDPYGEQNGVRASAGKFEQGCLESSHGGADFSHHLVSSNPLLPSDEQHIPKFPLNRDSATKISKSGLRLTGLGDGVLSISSAPSTARDSAVGVLQLERAYHYRVLESRGGGMEVAVEHNAWSSITQTNIKGLNRAIRQLSTLCFLEFSIEDAIERIMNSTPSAVFGNWTMQQSPSVAVASLLKRIQKCVNEKDVLAVVNEMMVRGFPREMLFTVAACIQSIRGSHTVNA